MTFFGERYVQHNVKGYNENIATFFTTSLF